MVLETGAFLESFQGLKNGVRKYTGKPCGRISGGVAEQGGGLRAEGTILGGGWGGLRAWCPLGVQMGVGVQHLADVQDVRVSEKMG